MCAKGDNRGVKKQALTPSVGLLTSFAKDLWGLTAKVPCYVTLCIYIWGQVERTKYILV